MRAITSVLNRFTLLVGAASLALSVGALAQSQAPSSQEADAQKSVSLGDLARQQRTGAHPKAKRVVTNDDFSLSETAAVSQSRADEPATDKKEKDEKDKQASSDDKEKAKSNPYVDAVEAQKKRIADAQKKIQDLNTERRQRASAQYNDMGLLLRDPQKWNNDEKAIQDEIAQKQKEVDDANQKLEEARENARKNGVRVPD